MNITLTMSSFVLMTIPSPILLTSPMINVDHLYPRTPVTTLIPHQYHALDFTSPWDALMDNNISVFFILIYGRLRTNGVNDHFYGPSSCCSFLVLDLGKLGSLEYGLRGTWVSAGTSSSWTGHADLLLTNLSSGHAVTGARGGNLPAGETRVPLFWHFEP